MAIGDDFSVIGLDIRYTGTDHNGVAPGYYTVIEFHRWAQDLLDDAVASGNDELDITKINVSQRSTDNIITLINGYNIDDAAAEHLYDGSIIQDAGDTIYDGIVNFGNANVQIQILQDGSVTADDWWNYGLGGAHDGAADASVLTDSGESWTIDEWVGYTIKNTTDGSQAIITANTATTITGVLEGGTDNDWDISDAYLIGRPLNPDANAGISHRFMIKTRANGVDIDGRRLIGTARRFGNTFTEFRINGTARGNNVLALVDGNDLNNTTAAATVDGWVGITNTEGLNLIDVDNDSVNEEYYSQWDRSTFTINQFTERMKYLTRDGSAETIHLFNGEDFRGITHSCAYTGEAGGSPATNEDYAWGTAIAYDNETVANFVVGEAIHEDSATPVWKGRVLAVDDDGTTGTLIVDVTTGTVLDPSSFTGQTSGAKADVNVTPTAVTGGGVLRLLAVDDDGTTGNIYFQLYKGTAPAASAILYDDTNVAKTLTVSGSPTARTVSTPFFGTTTGSALIGAYGFALESTDLAAADSVIDLSGAVVTPPNNVTNTVGGLVSGEDRVLVAPWDGVTLDLEGNPAINKAQLSLNTALVADNITSVIVDEAPPHGTPGDAYLRVTDDLGFERRLHYTAFSGTGPTTFTIDTTDGNEDFLGDEAAIGNDVFIAYIDELASGTSASYSAVHTTGTDDLVVLVRDGGVSPIKEFISSWTFASAGQTINAIRTTDE